MKTQTTPDYYTGHYRTDRPCVDCGATIEEGDAYCANCGAVVKSLADCILAWKPDPNARSLEDRPSGAALAKQVRMLLKPLGLRVHTEDGYYVDVKLPVPNFWYDEERRVYVGSIHEAPYQNRWHQAHYEAAAKHLRSKLHTLYHDTAGTRDDSPGADYPYASLPILTVNGLG